MSGSEWGFWTGNAQNPVVDAYRRLAEQYAEEEQELRLREQRLTRVGQELGGQFGFSFLELHRRHAADVRVNSDPRLPAPPKRDFYFTFVAGPQGLAQRKVLARLAPLPEGISFGGTLSRGWTLTMRAESAAEKLAELREQRLHCKELKGRAPALKIQ